MDATEMDRIVEEHLRAEVAADIPALLATLTDDIEHDTAGAPDGPLHGLAEVKNFYDELFGEMVIDDFTSVRRWHGSDHVVDDAYVTLVATGQPFGFDGHNRTVKVRILHVFDFAAGKISRENTWIDMASLAAQLPASPAAPVPASATS